MSTAACRPTPAGNGRAFRPVTEVAARAITEQLSGFAEGDRVPSERDLCESLGLSRPAVREALVMLETAGELYSVPGKGRFRSRSARGTISGGEGSDWAIHNGARVKDLDEIREILEARCIQHMSPSQARQAGAEAMQIVDDAAAAAAAGEFVQAGELDTRFHRLLCSFTSNRPLRDLTHQLIDATARDAAAGYAVPGAADHSLAQHLDIVHALADGDVQVAALLVAAHASSGGRFALRAAQSAKAEKVGRRRSGRAAASK